MFVIDLTASYEFLHSGDELGRLCDVYAVVDAATTNREKRRRAQVSFYSIMYLKAKSIWYVKLHVYISVVIQFSLGRLQLLQKTLTPVLENIKEYEAMVTIFVLYCLEFTNLVYLKIEMCIYTW